MIEEIRILKVASCLSLSSRSTLTYHIGCNGKEIYIRLQGNSSGGMFSKEWIGLDRFELSKEQPITARSIHEYFHHKSINTSGFLMAVLKSESLIKPMEEKSRTYRRCDPTAFKTAIQALIDSDSEVSLEPTAPAPPSPKKKGRK